MTPIKISLPEVKASGGRKGWWLHVTGLSTETRTRFSGFGSFEGERLDSGEVELPPLAVILLARPVGSARADARVIDVMTASPASGQLVGIAYGCAWDGGADHEKLRVIVAGALQSQRTFADTERKLEEALSGWIGRPCTPEQRVQAYAAIEDTLKAVLPSASVMCLGSSDSRKDGVTVEIRIPTKDCARLIRCAVPGYDSEGDEDFAFLYIRVPMDYVDNYEAPDLDTPHHAQAARKAAKRLGVEVERAAPVYDDESTGRWSPLLDLFDWETASVFDLEGGLA